MSKANLKTRLKSVIPQRHGRGMKKVSVSWWWLIDGWIDGFMDGLIDGWMD